MRPKALFLTIVAVLYLAVVQAQDDTDAVIFGHVVSKGEHIPFVNIFLEGTTIGTTTDITGHYMLVDLPVGEYTLIARMVGYKEQKRPVTLKSGTTVELNFNLD